MSVPQPRRAQDRERAASARSRAGVRELRRVESSARALRSDKQRPGHRLSWFGAVQGVLMLGFVMIGTGNRWLSASLVCIGIALCLPAVAVAGKTGRIRRPVQLLLAALWAVAGSFFLLAGGS